VVGEGPKKNVFVLLLLRMDRLSNFLHYYVFDSVR